jgi:trigger factor
VEIGESELGQAIMAQARRYPGQEREFFDYVRKHREALEQIRAPLYEDKVVDLILERADVTETPVSKDELQAELDQLDEDGTDRPADTDAPLEKPA